MLKLRAIEVERSACLEFVSFVWVQDKVAHRHIDTYGLALTDSENVFLRLAQNLHHLFNSAATDRCD